MDSINKEKILAYLSCAPDAVSLDELLRWISMHSNGSVNVTKAKKRIAEWNVKLEC